MTRFTSLRFRLLLLILLAVVPALGLTLYTSLEQRQQATLKAQDEAMWLARQVAHDYEHLIEDTHGLDLAWFNELAAEAQLPPGSTLTVIDHKGTILACYPDPEKWVGQTMPDTPLIEAVLAQKEGVTETTGLDGTRRLVAFTPLRGPSEESVYVSIGIPIAAAYAEANWTLARNLVALALLSLLALAVAGGVAELSIVRWVEVVLAAAKRLRAGDLNARTGVRYGVGELGQLAHAFDEMAESLQQREAERQRAEEQVQRQLQRLNALRKIDTAITASLDPHVTLNIILDQVTAQLGVDAADILLFNPHTQTLEFAVGRGFRSNALQHTNLRLGNGYAGRAALERRIVRIANLEEAENGLRRAPLLPQEEFVSYLAVPLIAKDEVKGVLEIFHRAQLDSDPEWLGFLETLAGQAAIALDNAALFNNLQRSNVELALAYDTTLEGWAKALELRDRETEGHTRRVTEMTIRIARLMGISEAELVHVRRGALLHDIGKIAISDTILLKPEPLTNEEWEIMHQHPVYAYQLLSPIAYLRPALDIPYCHHEKWDGTGYPRGLKGEQIPLAARIFAVVDVWDALLSDRPYRPAWSKEKAIEYIKEQAGKHFDPQVVEVFLKLAKNELAHE
jgi:HD-GYP domain-containing protein (c-di-GMP phosphodiesterase class II)